MTNEKVMALYEKRKNAYAEAQGFEAFEQGLELGHNPYHKRFSMVKFYSWNHGYRMAVNNFKVEEMGLMGE